MAETEAIQSTDARDPIIRKLFFVGFLVLVLLVPIGWIRDLVDERAARQAGVRSELTSTWGGSQTITGPMLVVPYLEHRRTNNGDVEVRTCLAWFLPETLAVTGGVEPERRSRGIFDVILYRTRLAMTAKFARPDFSIWKIDESDVVWDGARIAIGIPDLRGVDSDPKATWDAKPLPFAPGAPAADLFRSGMQAVPGGLAARAATSHELTLDIGIPGSDELRFVPVAKETDVHLTSPWPSPSFVGAFLPSERTVDAKGFDASWRVSYFARPFAQQWRRADVTNEIEKTLAASSFGLRMIDPVDFYCLSNRAVKYASLFVVLTFLAFGLFEILAGLRIHPLQYLLVGLAICLFYLMLLSLSEHVGFGPAYAIGTAATVALVGGYTRNVLGGAGRAITVSVLVTALYGYLYVLLRIEDYALLLGTGGLFVILAAVMYLTRNLDWYALGGRPVAEVA
jgi:inner membrane protein